MSKPSHRLFSNTNSLLSWDELFEIQYRYCSDDKLSSRIILANCLPEIEELHYDRISENTTRTVIIQSLTECGIEAIEKRFNDMYNTLGIEEFKQQKEKENLKSDCAVYTSFFPSSMSHGIHRDATDVFHWQHLGYTEWNVYDKETHTYMLKPGDCIFIPKGMYHDIIPLTARAGVSFGFFSQNEDYNLDDYDYGNEYIKQHITKEMETKFKTMMNEKKVSAKAQPLI